MLRASVLLLAPCCVPVMELRTASDVRGGFLAVKYGLQCTKSAEPYGLVGTGTIVHRHKKSLIFRMHRPPISNDSRGEFVGTSLAFGMIDNTSRQAVFRRTSSG